jgi:predicted hotdog family 3-hydroxylacyl-ACP dehydratase
MNMIEDIENLIPHRERLKLIDAIISVDQKHAVCTATVKESWPLLSGEGVCAIVLVELAAQTSGICIGWNEKLKTGRPQGEAGGWLVGVKKAHFHVDKIPLNTCITIRSENRLVVENYKEVAATARVGQTLVSEIVLQILLATRDDE